MRATLTIIKLSLVITGAQEKYVQLAHKPSNFKANICIYSHYQPVICTTEAEFSYREIIFYICYHKVSKHRTNRTETSILSDAYTQDVLSCPVKPKCRLTRRYNMDLANYSNLHLGNAVNNFKLYRLDIDGPAT